MSRIQLGRQLLGSGEGSASAVRAPAPAVLASCRTSINLTPWRCTSRALTQTCQRPKEESSKPPAPPILPTDGSPAAPPAAPPAHSGSTFSSIFSAPSAPTPTAPPSQPPPLPLTASWLAATGGSSPSSTSASGSSLTDLSKMTFGLNFMESALPGSPNGQSETEKAMNVQTEPFHLHIFAHKHNTHITLTRPNNDVVLAISNGNLGFKHSKRKHYDAAYQLMQHMITLIDKKGLLQYIPNIEVVLKGYGQGREAAAKVLLSPEGIEIKKKIVRVADATTLKFGGTRSKNPRRI